MQGTTRQCEEVKEVYFIGIIGRPGSGKGMVSRYLRDRIPASQTVSLGQIIRDSTHSTNRFHDALRVAREEHDTGGLPNPEHIWPVARQTIIEAYQGGVRTYIADGFPRTDDHPQLLQQLFEDLRAQDINVIDRYIYLLASEAVSTERIAHRRVQWLREGLDARLDDSLVVQETRRELFEKKTWGAVRQLAQMGKLIVIDARRSLDEVLREVSIELNRDKPRPISEVFTELWPQPTGEMQEPPVREGTIGLR
jgi:adenylate kinase family enzyme